MTLTEERLFNHLLRMVSVLVIIGREHDAGHTATALPGNLMVARAYLRTHCPSLLAFVENVYRGEDVPDSLSLRAMQELALTE